MPTALQATQAASSERFSSPGKQGSPPLQKQTGQDKGKKPLYQNRSWVRGRDPEPAEGSPDGLDTGIPSLLSRMGSPSLLKRIAPSGEASASSSVRDGLEPLLVDMGESDPVTEDVKMREEHVASRSNEVRVKVEETAPAIPSPKTERRVGKARGSRSTIDVFGEPTVPLPSSETSELPGTTPRQDVKSHSPSPTPVSESAVEDLLATILPPQALVASPSREPSISPSRESGADTRTPCENDVDMTASRNSMSAEPVISASASSALPRPVLEQCRDLLVPSIMQFAIRRNPNLDTATAQKRILSRLSDDQCAEFVGLARRMRAELQAQRDSERAATVSHAGSRSPSKRPIDGDERDGSEQRAVKIARKHSPGDVVDGERADTAVTHYGLATSRVHSSDPALFSREGGHMVETVAEAPADASATDHLTIASDPRSRTPTSGLACSRSTSHSTAHTPPVPFTASLPSVEEAVPLSESAGLLTARSPVASEHGVSAPTSLPPTTISQSATLPIPGRSQSPNVFKTRQTATPILSDTRHHDPVTPVPPAATEPPEDPSIPVAQDFSGYHMQEKQGTEEASMQQPPTLVPAFWAAVTGRRSADIETIEFFVDDATADATRNWARRKETFSFEHKHVVVHLLCLPEDAVSECYQNMSPSATREDIVAAMWNIKTEWPPAGTLVVQTDPPGSSWVPGHDSGPLELTHAIKRGMNRFRLIQLTDMSNKLFVIHATEPSAEERKAVGALTVGWTQTLAKLAPHSPRRTSEPVAVRASVVA